MATTRKVVGFEMDLSDIREGLVLHVPSAEPERNSVQYLVRETPTGYALAWAELDRDGSELDFTDHEAMLCDAQVISDVMIVME